MNEYASDVFTKLSKKYPWETEFLSSVKENFDAISVFLDDCGPMYKKHKILENLVEPDRIISFRVPWKDDQGDSHVNTGYRVEFNNVLGPYKGGLRFHSDTSQSVLKFLGFEQTFKNSLTGLAMGGGKGGSDFNPNGRSDNEILNFCQSFMLELARYIGPTIDVPAGDIGVGAREIGYLFGQYRRLHKSFNGALTGKGIEWGGSLLRPEATGFGVVYFLNEMLKKQKDALEGKKVVISGFGNVSWGVVKKIDELGGKVITLSGPDGYIHDPAGISGEKIDYMLQMRLTNHDKVSDYAEKFKVDFFKDKRPWEVNCDIAIPCAIQNELGKDDINRLIKNGTKYLLEGANQPLSDEAVEIIQKSDIIYAPGKASNAGGVACSHFEMAQNASLVKWDKKKVDTRLKQVMKLIHKQCYREAKEFGQTGNYLVGANIVGFKRVADAMIDQGMV
jgi:glutamate dehydrogenase (NADP+)